MQLIACSRQLNRHNLCLKQKVQNIVLCSCKSTPVLLTPSPATVRQGPQSHIHNHYTPSSASNILKVVSYNLYRKVITIRSENTYHSVSWFITILSHFICVYKDTFWNTHIHMHPKLLASEHQPSCQILNIVSAENKSTVLLKQMQCSPANIIIPTCIIHTVSVDPGFPQRSRFAFLL